MIPYYLSCKRYQIPESNVCIDHIFHCIDSVFMYEIVLVLYILINYTCLSYRFDLLKRAFQRILSGFFQMII